MYRFFFTHSYINTKNRGVGGGGVMDTRNNISYETLRNKQKDVHVFILSFYFQLHSQHLDGILRYIYLKQRYNTNTNNITLMASLTHKKQLTKQHFQRQEKAKSSITYPLHTYNTCTLMRHKIKKQNNK